MQKMHDTYRTYSVECQLDTPAEGEEQALTCARLGGAGGITFTPGLGTLNIPSLGPAEGYMEFSGSLSNFSLGTSFSGRVRVSFGGIFNRFLISSAERDRGGCGRQCTVQYKFYFHHWLEYEL